MIDSSPMQLFYRLAGLFDDPFSPFTLQFLIEVGDEILNVLQETDLTTVIGSENIFPAEPTLYAATETALSKAEAWLKAKCS